MNSKLLIGNLGEKLACDFLLNKNYEIVKRNFRCKSGEIDIIAVDRITNELAFIEVKTRTNTNYGLPCEAVNMVKIQHIKKCISTYLSQNTAENCNIRIDVIEVLLKGKDFFINHIKCI